MSEGRLEGGDFDHWVVRLGLIPHKNLMKTSYQKVWHGSVRDLSVPLSPTQGPDPGERGVVAPSFGIDCETDPKVVAMAS